MVYTGKPSRGCRTCRARRIKCDEGKPTCKRCEKSKRECGGYRPEFEIVHRDQTGLTVRRMSKTAGRKSQQPTGATTEEQQRSWRRHSSSPSPALTVPIAQRASCYFASNFILLPLGATSHGFMDYIVPLIDSEPPGSALRCAFNACAFALLGNRLSADGVDLAQLSLREHTLALAQTHKAIGHPAMARANATLAAVLLLCLYENITAIKESRMLAWRSHIDGAVHLVKLRGRDEMCQTKTGLLLFTAVRNNLISRTLSSGIPLPLGIDFWMSGGDAESLYATCQRFAFKYSEIRAEASQIMAAASSSSSHASIERMREMAKRVQRLDHDIANWMASIPPEFRFKTLYDIGLSNGHDDYAKDEAFQRRIDVYPDFVTAGAWNIGRVTRLLLASVSIRLTARMCSPLDYRTTPEYEAARRVCEGAISEIIASVPYHLGLRTKHAELFDNKPGLTGFACGEEGPGKALPALFLLWSLACVKNHDMTSEEQRAWVKGRLKFIADGAGLKYAHIINEVDLRFPSMMIRQDGLMLHMMSLAFLGIPYTNTKSYEVYFHKGLSAQSSNTCTAFFAVCEI
ncbi:hypothetical protein VTK56DRAFT_387 [Thermocarpiscus australiensis]